MEAKCQSHGMNHAQVISCYAFFIAKILGKLTKIDEFLIFLARRGTVWHEFGLFGDFGADGCLGTCDGAGLYERLPKCAPRCLVLKTLSL